MEDLLVCRVCLATDVNLYNMFKYQLASTFETLTGIKIASPGSPLLHHLCSYCRAMLVKCSSFLDKCRNAQDLLDGAMQQDMLVTEYFRHLDRDTHSLTLPYAIKHESYSVPDTSIKTEENIEKKQPIGIHIIYEERHEESDEEPLALIAIKSHKKRKKSGTVRMSPSSVIENDLMIKIEQDADDDQMYNNDEGDDDDNDEDDEKSDEFVNHDIEIVRLSKEEQIEEVQARKGSVNYLNSCYKCELCYKGFMTDTTYNNHMARHDPLMGRYGCDVCHTRWPHQRALKAHLNAAHANKYVCRRCSYVSKSNYKAKEHSKWHDGFRYVCDICGATFSKSTSHLTHMRLQHPSGAACEICGECFIGEYGIRMHKRKAHRNTTTPPSPPVKCVSCSAVFRSSAALRTHTDLNAGRCDPHTRGCSYCGQNFPSAAALKAHTKEHLTKETVNCLECNRVFANGRSYAVHYQRFHLGVPAKREGARCAGGGGVVCEVCGKKCISKATLVYHQRTHTGEKPFQCAECPKRFSIYQRLQIHLRTHTGERPFKCKHCPKAFKHKAALNRHDRVHSGAKPYCCPNCGKCFSQSNSMKMHVRTVHLKMPAPYRHNKKTKDAEMQ